MTLQQYCEYLGWDQAELERQADINYRTARSALAGEKVSPRIARKIAQAISEAMGKTIYPGEIQGLNFG